MLPIGKSVRLAIITNIGRNYVECSFYDKFGEKPFRCPIPHPYAGRGGGILIGIERDTIVLVSNGPQEQWFIVAVIPDVNFYFDLDGVENIRTGETSYPALYEGEISIKGNPGQRIDLLRSGNIAIDANIGDKSYDLELSKTARGMFVRTDNIYYFTEAGRRIEGIVKRDINETEDAEETNTTDFLAGETYEKMLSPIGRSPKDEDHNRTTTVLKPITRNPSFVEVRDIVYEFGDSFGVRDFETEKTAMIRSVKTGSDEEIRNSISSLRTDPSIRENRRTDVLDLNLKNYNHLIERVQGTVVDIYGNLLDLNRNKINVPEVETISDDIGGKALKRVYDHLRRTIKYHFEINSRKDITDAEPQLPKFGTIPEDNLREHSRFSIDIDAEGLTKINVPATSETGNIPVLSRYIVSKQTQDGRTTENGAFKDPEETDVRIAQFGAQVEDTFDTIFAGQEIKDSSYLPKSTNNIPITVGTAFHDMFNVAASIFKNGRLKSPNPNESDTEVPPLERKVNNRIPETDEEITNENRPNAGGRSLHLNLDGSLEASVGSDTVDRKSMVLDLAGGMIAHLGRDKNGRSLIQQFDGDVIIQVGGKSVKDPRFVRKTLNGELVNESVVQHTEDRPGRLEIHFNTGADKTPHKILIDEGGITISSADRMLFESQGDMILASGSNLLISAENIKQFGAYDYNTRSIIGSESASGRSGTKK